MKSKLLKVLGVTAAMAIPVGGVSLLSITSASATTPPAYAADATLGAIKLTCAGTTVSSLPCTVTAKNATPTAPTLTSLTVKFEGLTSNTSNLNLHTVKVVIDSACTVTFKGTVPIVATTPSTWFKLATTPTKITDGSGGNVKVGILCSLTGTTLKNYIQGKTATLLVKK